MSKSVKVSTGVRNERNVVNLVHAVWMRVELCVRDKGAGEELSDSYAALRKALAKRPSEKNTERLMKLLGDLVGRVIEGPDGD